MSEARGECEGMKVRLIAMIASEELRRCQTWDREGGGGEPFFILICGERFAERANHDHAPVESGGKRRREQRWIGKKKSLRQADL
jgi:hypothetical protein